MMRLSGAIAVLTLVVAVHLPLTAALAQDVKLEVKSSDTVKSVLERMVGKRVSVVLTSGPELSGVVSSVGDKVVLLTQLTGREFFDGIVNIEQIGAVIVRTRNP
jgi:hypothetical protein